MTAALGPPVATVVGRDGTRPVLMVTRWRHGGAECEAPAGDVLDIVLNLSHGQHVERRAHGAYASAPATIGSVTVADPQEPTTFAVRGRADVLRLFLPVALVAAATGGAVIPAAIAVHPRFQAADPVLERAALRALVLLGDGAMVDDLRLATLAYQLADALAERADPRAARRARGGVTARARRSVDDLISARLAMAAPPALGDLADAAGVSVFHFAREFRHTVGETPHAYVLRRRLEFARDLLARSSVSVADVGRRAGFVSPAHFSAQFRRYMGITPRTFRDAVRR